VGVACVLMARPSSGHGYLYFPPSRSSMWRYPEWKPYVNTNTNDNELNCGGLWNQINNGYKCGVCGDPYQDEIPRDNEVGGKYASPVWRPITANFSQGQMVEFKVRITAHHKGWIGFKLCPTNDFSVSATQDCLDAHPVALPSGDLQYDVDPVTPWYNVTFALPSDLKCDLCVLQWRYHVGNNWGSDDEGEGIGYGYQEEFYGCADVSIGSSGGNLPTNSPPNPPTAEPTKPQTDAPTEPQTPPPSDRPNTGGSCVAIGPWAGQEALDDWCTVNCNAEYFPNCPEDMCLCA